MGRTKKFMRKSTSSKEVEVLQNIQEEKKDKEISDYKIFSSPRVLLHRLKIPSNGVLLVNDKICIKEERERSNLKNGNCSLEKTLETASLPENQEHNPNMLFFENKKVPPKVSSYIVSKESAPSTSSIIKAVVESEGPSPVIESPLTNPSHSSTEKGLIEVSNPKQLQFTENSESAIKLDKLSVVCKKLKPSEIDSKEFHSPIPKRKTKSINQNKLQIRKRKKLPLKDLPSLQSALIAKNVTFNKSSIERSLKIESVSQDIKEKKENSNSSAEENKNKASPNNEHRVENEIIEISDSPNSPQEVLEKSPLLVTKIDSQKKRRGRPPKHGNVVSSLKADPITPKTPGKKRGRPKKTTSQFMEKKAQKTNMYLSGLLGELTPRLSNRIKNKKEKFSVRKLLGLEKSPHAYSQKLKTPRKKDFIAREEEIDYEYFDISNKSDISYEEMLLEDKFESEDTELSHSSQTVSKNKIIYSKSSLKGQASDKRRKLSNLVNGAIKIKKAEHSEFPVKLGPEITVTRIKKTLEKINQNKQYKTMKHKSDYISEPEVVIRKRKKSSKNESALSKKLEKSSETSNSEPEVSSIKNTSKTLEELPDKTKKLLIKSSGQGRSKMPKISMLTDNKESEGASSIKENPPSSGDLLKPGKKTAKVTPLTANQISSLEKYSSKNIIEKGDELSEKVLITDSVSIGKIQERHKSLKRFTNKQQTWKEELFDWFFKTNSKECDHYESLDSSTEDEQECLSHFIGLKENQSFPITKEEPKPQEKESNHNTIYALMEEVSLEMPSWNLHVLEDTKSFCITHVGRGPLDIPVMKKIIELDENFNAKVYINQNFHREFCGTYDTYTSIKELIKSVDKL